MKTQTSAQSQLSSSAGDDHSAAEEEDEIALSELEKSDSNLEPEVFDPAMDEVVTWDEPEGQAGRRVPPLEAEDEGMADEELVASGLETAENELRDEEELQSDLEEQESDRS